MTPTTDQLKDLMAKVTKPWRYEIDEDDGVHVVHCAVIGPYPHISTSEPDLGSDHMKLIALAPTLAAEVVRLRTALADMLFEYGGRYDDECLVKDYHVLAMIDRARQALDATREK